MWKRLVSFEIQDIIRNQIEHQPLVGLLNISQNDSCIENDCKRQLTREISGSVQKGLSSKAAATLASGAYRLVREHDKGARTPLASFFNTPFVEEDISTNHASRLNGSELFEHFFEICNVLTNKDYSEAFCRPNAELSRHRLGGGRFD